MTLGVYVRRDAADAACGSASAVEQGGGYDVLSLSAVPVSRCSCELLWAFRCL